MWKSWAFAIEVKSGKSGYRATGDQLVLLKQWEKAGAIAMLAIGEEGLNEVIDTFFRLGVMFPRRTRTLWLNLMNHLGRRVRCPWLLEPDIYREIMQHARDEAPNEMCGVISRKGGKPHYVRCKNFSPTPEHHFILKGHEKRKHRPIIAIVHSHPSGAAYPSWSDRRQQVGSGVQWLIALPHQDKIITWRGLLSRPVVIRQEGRL